MTITPADLGTYLGATIDVDRAATLLTLATQLCQSIITPLPTAADAVVLDVAVRAYSNPGNVTSQGAGPFPVAYGAVSGGLWLTRQNKATLRRLAGSGGAFTIDMLPATAGAGLSWWNLGSPNAGDSLGDWDQIP